MPNEYRSIPKPGQAKKHSKPVVRTKVKKITTVSKAPQVVHKPHSQKVARNIRQAPPQKATVQPKKQIITKRSSQAKTIRNSMIKSRIASRATSVHRSVATDQNGINAIKGIGRGKTLVILACGPSVNEIPIEKLKGHPLIHIMCINKPNPKVWPSTYWAFCDQSQYRRNKEQFRTYSNLIINSTAVRERKSDNQIIIRSRPKLGWSRDLTQGFYIGRSTVYANMQTALWMDYSRVYIFGIDMCKVGGSLHFYGNNPDVDDDVRMSRFKKESDNYEKAYNTMNERERDRFRICSSYNPWPFAEMFGKIDHKKAIDVIIKEADEMSNKFS